MKGNKKEQPVYGKDELMLKRSNQLIEARYHSSLMEKKLVALSMSKMTIRDGKLVSRIPVGEIREALNYHGGGIYQQLKDISTETVQHYMFLEDDAVNHTFDLISVVERARYASGILEFTFNDVIKKHTLDVNKRYTAISVDALLSFKSNYTYRIYELLMVHFYKIPQDGAYQVDYDLAELKFMIGLIPMDEKVQRAVRSGMSYAEVIENYIPDPPYKTWYNFKRVVLDRGKEEIDKSSRAQIHFDFKPLQAGRGAKTYGVRFFLTRSNKPGAIQDTIASDMVTDENVEKLLDYANGDLTSGDVIALLTHAKNNLEKVISVYNCVKKAKNIKSRIGWMISAIDNNWDLSEAEKEFKEPDKVRLSRKNSFSDFEQREYDFDALESAVLNKNKRQSGEEFDISREHKEENAENNAPVLQDMKISDLDPEIQKLIFEKMKNIN